MQDFVLFTDSDCDITPVDCAKYGYHLISMPYSVEGKTIYPYEDFEVFEADPYYDMLRDGTLPTTSALTKEKYIEYFEPIFAEGKNILYAHFSRELQQCLNGSYQMNGKENTKISFYIDFSEFSYFRRFCTFDMEL